MSQTRHPADPHGLGRRWIIEQYRMTQPLDRLEQTLRNTKRGRYGPGDWMVASALHSRKMAVWDVWFWDRCMADPRLTLDVFCFSCHGFRGEHKSGCKFSPEGIAHIAWLRRRLNLPTPCTDFRRAW